MLLVAALGMGIEGRFGDVIVLVKFFYCFM